MHACVHDQSYALHFVVLLNIVYNSYNLARLCYALIIAILYLQQQVRSEF